MTPAFEDGLILAALLAGDRTLAQVEGALSPECVQALRRRLVDVEVSARAQLMATLLERVRPPLESPAKSLPPRMVGLLISHLPRRVARALGPFPTARERFRLSSELTPLLLRLARAAAEERSA